MKNSPIPPNETERLAALRAYNILDTLPEKQFDRITELASIICNTPISLITLMDENRQWFKSKLGMEINETSRDIAFCRYTLLNSQILEVEDAANDERFRENPLVTDEESHIRFYAGYPLIDNNGHALGSLCVLDKVPRKLSTEQRRALQILGTSVLEMIVTQRRNQELQNFEKLFNISNDLICIAGTDGSFQRLNPAFHKVLGWDEEYLLQISFFDLVHPDDLQATRRHFSLLAAGKPTVNFTHRLKCRDGEYKNLQWVATPEPTTGYLFAIARDITQEKQKELRLYNSENRFRAFFENSQGLMCTHDLNGKFLSINISGAASLGYEPAELLHLGLFDIVPAHFHSNLHAYLQSIRTEKHVRGTMHTQHKDGSTLIWLFNNILEEDLEGNEYVIGNAVDITERHKLEEALKFTTQMLEQTNEAARIGTWDFNVITGEIYWSKLTRELHEVPDDYVPEFESAVAFMKTPDVIKEAVETAIDAAASYELDQQIITAKGNERWVRIIGTPEFQDGKCVRLYGTFQDIDEEKKAKQALLNEKARLTAFVKHAPAAVAMFDTKVRYVAYSNRWLEDYHLNDDIMGRSHYEVFPNISDEWKAIHARVLQGAVEKKEEDIWRPEGWDHDQYLYWEVRPWYQYDGSIGGLMMFTQDITDASEQREELKRAKLQAEQSSIAKSEFLANMSHEIRTPLNGVIGFTDLMLKTSLNATQEQYLSIVNQSANSLLGIINDILDFSKIEAGKLDLDIDKTDLYELSTHAADTITYQVENKKLELLLDIPEGLPRFIWTDSVRLKQVLINLLSNAVKFTEEGEIRLVIRQAASGNGKALLHFEVTDTGIGIQPEKQQSIFEAFSQEDHSTTKKYGGTGLGLTISNKLLGLMGSRLELQSTPGKGSSFSFNISVKAEYETPAAWSGLEKIRKVLIVDDNENNRIILRQMLQLRGIHSDEAASGIEALQILDKGGRYDALLMDYHMPYLDGLETVKKIRESLRRPLTEQPLILLQSSSEDEAFIHTCELLNIRQRLVKPIKSADLYHALYHLFNQEAPPVEDTLKKNEQAAMQQLNVMVVEDNMVNMLLTKTIVRKIAPNALITEAGNGVQAIEKYALQQPDLILMDIQMPVMNGYEATQKIRQNQGNVHIPIIALTAGNVLGEREKCLAAGMDDFIAKPIVEESLRPLFKKWIASAARSAAETSPAVAEPVNTGIHFDLQVIKGYVGEDPDILKDILTTTLTELKSSLAVLGKQVTGEDLAGIKATGHKLYGTAATAGMKPLAEMARSLEYQTEFNTKTIGDLFGRVRTEINHITSMIEGLIQ
ncbi:PAS domain S-box protein [Sediminibacterium ginsengisoli]|uniref:Sensory/regulatory protein RpfC n=1 Tax=Sediminibacterium ginsengisoli TaxID=413434 RepID=A0A1T4RFD9_9BACT|nr:PAS domain S-box protein [Sediminibacterium ginsengisoli]SKA14695.1 PAS domain S-box-containing protein [Sediminibacterium ginsengisoli]